MSIQPLSASGHLSSPRTGDRRQGRSRFAAVLGYAVAGGCSLLIWGAVLSLGLQIVR